MWITILISLIVVIASGELWRLGGNGYKIARAIGVPTVIVLAKLFLTQWNWIAVLYAPLLWGAMAAFSYGIDAPIHNFFEWVFQSGNTGNNEAVEISTRAVCGLLWALPAAVFAYISGAWILFGLYCAFMAIANAFFGRVKNVEISERGVGASVATSIFI